MMMSATTGIRALAALGLLVIAGEAPADAAGDGSRLYAVCTACHSADGSGNRQLGAPRIQGLADWYLIRQLESFKVGLRGSAKKDFFGAQMRPMAMTLPDAKAIADVVAYIGTLEADQPRATAKGDVAAGKTAYAVCSACHGAAGEGNKLLNAPRLAGQHDWYIVNQLNKFRAGLRGSNPGDIHGAQMRPMAMALADEKTVNDVAAYIASLDQL